jgi:dihydroorotate dehydrogenase
VFGLEFPNPLGMAPGFDKNARVPRELLALGFGFVEVGTLTPRPQSGNRPPRLFRSTWDHAIINRLGFNNEGEESALARLTDPPQGIVGVNIGANRDSEDRIADYVTGVERMAPVASYLTVNISSPNTPGLRDLQAPDALDALLKRIQAALASLTKRPPLLVKLAPDIAEDVLPRSSALSSPMALMGSSCRTRRCRGMGSSTHPSRASQAACRAARSSPARPACLPASTA